MEYLIYRFLQTGGRHFIFKSKDNWCCKINGGKNFFLNTRAQKLRDCGFGGNFSPPPSEEKWIETALVVTSKKAPMQSGRRLLGGYC